MCTPMQGSLRKARTDCPERADGGTENYLNVLHTRAVKPP